MKFLKLMDSVRRFIDKIQGEDCEIELKEFL